MGAHSPLQTQELFGDKILGLEDALVRSGPCGSPAVPVGMHPEGKSETPSVLLTLSSCPPGAVW